MKTNKTTELVFILDRSGSMSGLEADTIGGFNAMLAKQKKQKGSCWVSTLLFDSSTSVLHDRLPLDQVPDMTAEDYQVCGCTALLDAIGGAIHHIANIHKYARPEDVPTSTLFVIMTDGMENASHRFHADEVRNKITHMTDKYGWEFMFIGANIDAVEAAGRFGIREDRAVNYHADGVGTEVVYDSVSEAVSAIRCECALPKNWNQRIHADYQSRKRGNR
ncbi:MAG: VWA domain-containing protein [Oscillospiraceae bacterium]|nr:VWA domain-containing protein [Oscillospiraceae bacterium]